MRIIDMLTMSCQSLWKRKVRTILTILGVVIGVASIVVMVSLGLGLQRATMESVERFGGATSITVREARSYDSTIKEKDRKHLDDALIDELLQIEHVRSVEPVLSINADVRYGAYQGSFEIKGMRESGLRSLNLKLEDGELPLDANEVVFLYGNMTPMSFYNPKTGESVWSNGAFDKIDLKGGSIFVTYDTGSDTGGNGRAGAIDDTTVTSKKQPKKHLAKYAGKLAGGQDDFTQHSFSVFTNMDALANLLRREFRGRAIPGQPTRQNGKPYRELFYSELMVESDSLDHTKEIQTLITDMGYEASSNSEWIEQSREQSGYIQAVLGGIGAVSLVVAAIGITNTMMMSIYERTREIGVMKVLGCDMGNIRAMFLLEAGFIGFFGGVAGCVISVIISIIINKVTAGMNLAGEGVGLSYIPPWLYLVSIVFAVMVGMVSGFFPARRAMHLSPLAAIRND